jgi:pyrroloquinoline quinone biosynthesis protein D
MTAPALSPHAMLRHDARRQCWVLLGPERVVVLDDTAHAILQRLDGRATIDAIAAGLARDYDAPAGVIAADIRELLADLAKQGLVRL